MAFVAASCLVLTLPAMVVADVVYASSSSYAEITVVDSDGNASFFADTGSLGKTGMAFDSDGNLYVADISDNRIDMVSPGGVVTPYSTSGMSGPAGLAFDTAGNLYVANLLNNTISRVPPGGGAAVPFVTTNLDGPFGLAFGHGSLFVANNAGNTIVQVNGAGVVTPFASSFLDGPDALAFDGAGNLLVTNNSGNSIAKFTPTGVGSIFYSGVASQLPVGLALDNAGQAYTVGFFNNSIYRIAADGLSETLMYSGGLINNGEFLALTTDAGVPLLAPGFFAPVPEAGSLLLVGAVAAAVGAARRCRRRWRTVTAGLTRSPHRLVGGSRSA